MKKCFLEEQKKIKDVKKMFEEQFSESLSLMEVQAPILVKTGTGVQDDLSGHEKSVKVKVSSIGEEFEVVHSLAKWKRKTLSDYDFKKEEGLYTNMKALRPDEESLSPIHSVYVDQWDWEKVICEKEGRTIKKLKEEVNKIYKALLSVHKMVESRYEIASFLPEEITFLHSEELLIKYPDKTAKERERAAAKEYGAVFLIGIGGKLSHGESHDVRAPDYDDWSTMNCDGYFGLNGDILVWNPIMQDVLELSSMGVRVSKESLERQLTLTGAKQFDWHKALLSGELKQTIGGGIGQSRMAMFLLQKEHIGQVQFGVWDNETQLKYSTL